MILRLVPLVTCLLVSVASAAPRRILVLPLDGNADGGTRGKLNGVVQKLVRAGAGDATVAVGDATFDETAAAVGCDPAVPKCAVSVRSTLGVDELVYGTVSTDPAGQTTLDLRRSSATADPPQATSAHLAAGQPPEEVERQIAPTFGVAPAPLPEPTPPPAPAAPPPPPRDHTRRNLGIAAVAGAGVMLAIGLLLWSSESGTQDDIDRAPANTVADIHHIKDLEDRAQTYAIAGDVLVLGALVLGGLGGYVLYTDHREKSVVVAPAATPSGPAVTIRGTW